MKERGGKNTTLKLGRKEKRREKREGNERERKKVHFVTHGNKSCQERR